MSLCDRITSRQNPRVKHLLRLRDNSHRKRQGLFLVEGLRECRRAHEAGWSLEALFFAEDLFPSPESSQWLQQLTASGEVPFDCVPMTGSVFRKVAYRQHPDGLLAIVHKRSRCLSDLPPNANPCYMVLVGMEKPGNLGAVLRTADAAGADACILADARCDPFNPNAVRASQGAFFHLPFVCATSAEVLAFLQERRILPVLTTPSGPQSFFDLELRQPVALVFGTESAGLPAEWLQAPGQRAALPMQGITDSLNVSATAAVALFETVRQRRRPT